MTLLPDMPDLTTEFIQYHSLTYYEMPLAQAIVRHCRQVGLPVEIDVYNPGDYLSDNRTYPDTANVYITIGSGSNTLLLHAPLDVAPAPDDLFQPVMYEADDQYLRGRGTATGTGTVAGLMWAALRTLIPVRSHDSRVVIALTADSLKTGTGARHSLQWLREQGYHNGNLSAVVAGPSQDFNEVCVRGSGLASVELQAPLKQMLPALRGMLAQRETWLSQYTAQSEAISSIELTTLQSDSTPPGAEATSVTATDQVTALEQALLQSEEPVQIATPADYAGLLPTVCYIWPNASADANPMYTATLTIRTAPEADTDVNGLVQQVLDYLTAQQIDTTIRQRTRAYQTNPFSDGHPYKMCKALISPYYQLDPATNTTRPTTAAYYHELTAQVVSEFGAGQPPDNYQTDEKIKLGDLLFIPETYERLIQKYLASIPWLEKAADTGLLLSFPRRRIL